MAQPRYKQFTTVRNDKSSEELSAERKKKFSRGCLHTFVVLFLIAVFGFLAYVFPYKNSITGSYIAPDTINDIEEYSQGRWHLHDAQRKIVESCASWYFKINKKDVKDFSQLQDSGFGLFTFVDPSNVNISVYPEDLRVKSIEDEFFFKLTEIPDFQLGIISRRTSRSTNILGKSWTAPNDKEFGIDPEFLTKKHTQFISNTNDFSNMYAAYLCEIWESSATGYSMVYRKVPTSFGQVMSGLGMKTNPNCVWPFNQEDPLRASCECGTINDEYVYWKVVLSDGTSYGRAWRWDYYITDPDKVGEQTAVSGIEQLENVSGQRNVLFSSRNMYEILMSAKPQPVDDDER
ncbi:MAG TPA: hypothetical protein VGB30_12365 [bacterium]|jgi:hypothetical protein